MLKISVYIFEQMDSVQARRKVVQESSKSEYVSKCTAR